jgi:hypothetical protein
MSAMHNQAQVAALEIVLQEVVHKTQHRAVFRTEIAP